MSGNDRIFTRLGKGEKAAAHYGRRPVGKGKRSERLPPLEVKG